MQGYERSSPKMHRWRAMNEEQEAGVIQRGARAWRGERRGIGAAQDDATVRVARKTSIAGLFFKLVALTIHGDVL